jgi:zinc transporter, ZIP family
MAMTRPFGWLRRLRGRGPRGHVLAAVCLLLGLVASGGGTRTADPPPPAAPFESVTVVQTVLCPGTMVFQLRNDGTQPVTIAQVSVNDAYWPFTANPGATLAPHRTASVTLRYAWDAGVAYDVQFISSTGATYATTIDASTTAGAPPCS